MAETLLSPVIDKLVDLLIEEAKSLKGVHRQVKSLKDELEIIEPFLRDAEAKSGRGELGDATRIWLKQLREEAERIEDVIDDYTYHLLHQRNQTGFHGSLSKGGHWVKSLNSRRDIASEIQDIEESLRKIWDRGVSYGLRHFEQGSSSTSTVVDPRIGSLFVDDDELVGIESLSKELVRCLVEGEPKRAVISLVGEGGIGKTTLARKVYNDAVEKGCFDHHVWITVSQFFDINKILDKLLTHVCPTSRGFIDVEEAFSLLRDSLQEKRYVIVFDDVWKNEFWSVINHAFPNNSNGSRILVTTRKSTVVESFRQISCDMIVQELQTWSTEQAWELFCKKAFLSESCSPELEQLSHEILGKCQGLPLAIVTVAGLLSRKEKSVVDWRRVLSDLNYQLEENNELSSVSKVLLLSYHDLPYHLKSCFLYFGMFPEDYSVYEGKLYKLWIAEGFVMSSNDKVLEQIAEEYLIELMSRNLILCELKYGTDRYCKVHDLIYDMISRRNNDLNFCRVFNRNKAGFKEKSRRFSVYDTTENAAEVVADFRTRSVIIFNVDELTKSFVVSLIKKCRLLKVLNIEVAPLQYLPKEVGNLVHLKYLCLNGTNVKSLPKSIGKLQSLQTLDARHTLVRELPIEINKLRKLRHIFVDAFDDRSEYSVRSYIGARIHEGIGSLDKLQTLCRIEATPAKVCLVSELRKLRELKSLSNSKVTAEMTKALGESIEKMNHLEQLHISSINDDEILDLDCISSHVFRLHYLQLSCRLERFPSWISKLGDLQGLELNFSRLIDEPLKCLGVLPNLAYLRLHHAYVGEELRFEENSFRKLKKLELRKLEGLKEVKIERGTLAVVEKLDFGPFPSMKEMPCGVQQLINVKSLRIFDMPKEFVKALQPEGGSEYWKIQHIGNVTFGYNKGFELEYEWKRLGSSELLQHLQETQ